MKKRTAIILRVVFSLTAVALVLAAVQFLHTPVKATDSQAAGEYYIKVVVHDTNSSGFDSCENSAGFLIVPTIKQSGKTGQTWSAKVTKNQWDTDGGTWTYTGDPVNGFPTQLRKVQTKSATATDWIKNNNSTRTSKINFKIYVSGDNSTWTKVLDYDEETRAGGKWSYTNAVNSSLYPKLDHASCVITGPDVVYSNPNDYGYGDYTVSNAKDQYGVAWGYDEVLWGSMDDTTSCIPDDGHRVYFLINKKDAPGGYSTDIFPLLYSSEDNTDVMGPTKTVQVRYRMDTIAVGETKKAVFDSNSNGAWFEFTPTEDGTYIFYSMGHADPDPKCEAYTYNSASNTLDYLGVADDGRADSELIGFHQYEFFYKLTATKGTTYQFKVFSYNVSLSGDFPVRLAKAVTMTFDSAFDSTLGLYSKEYTLPKDATVHLDKTGVSRPGHTLVGWSINQNGAHRVLKLKSETIPASQTKIYALWLPDQPETLTPNTSYTVPMGDNSNGRITFYQFTPSETRTYVIYATGNTDTALLVYDPETYAQSGTYEQFVDDATSPPFSVNSGSFLYQAELKAGQTYWFGVGNYYYDNTSNISFRFEDVYTVHYDLNDATLSLSIDDQVKYRDRDLTLSTTEPYRNGYEFLGWATSKDATQAEYAVGGTYSGNADVTLYAVWKVAEFTVKFCDYGGYVVKTETVKYGEDATPPPVEDLGRSPDPSYHYTFEMWDDSWFFITADRTVTAVYTPTPHTSSGWSSDDTRHWKRCETCQTLYYNYEQHTYSGKPQWGVWSNDNTVTATFNCDSCGHTYSPEVNITAEEVPATCMENAYTLYSASVTMGDQVYEYHSKRAVYQPNTKTGHTYVEPAETDWTWTPEGDGYTATVVVSCVHDDDTQTLTANVGISAETPATHLQNGSRTYTATATIGKQTFTADKTVTLNAAGHDWVHHDAAPAADCTATGTIEYWSCTGCSELRAANQETVITSIDDKTPGPHDWDYTSASVTYKWDGYTKCTATVPCKHCNNTMTVDADTITNGVTMTATCKVDGIRTYTAQFAIAGLGDSKEENLGKNAANHADYGTRIENENVIGADCMTPGSYDKVEYCLGCGEQVNSTHVVGEKDATNHSDYGTRVEKENEVTADCKTPGSYDNVTYCLGCGEQVNSTHVVGEKDATNHADYGTRIEKENEVTADCMTPGSYDNVEYCLGCGEQVNSTHVVGEKDATNHTDPQTQEASESSCTAHGYTEGVYCEGCHTWVSGHEELPLKAHTDVDGDGKCDACGQDTDVHQHVDADGDTLCDGCGAPMENHQHTDVDGDGKCDTCGQDTDVHQHTDIDGDGKCDACGQDTDVHQHVDADGDTLCDGCGAPMENHQHTDADGDGKCDTCGQDTDVHQHTDVDGDGKCDTCGQDTDVHQHTDVDGDGKCDTCGQDADVHQHVDEDGNGKCDGCGQELNPGFRCIMCDFVEAHLGIPVISWILILIHFFVHWLQSLFFGG